MKSIIAALLAASIAPSVAAASLATIEFQVEINKRFDFQTMAYVSIPSVSAKGSFTFEMVVRDTIDYGITTITTFGDVDGTVWSSPITSQLPEDPYSGAYGPFYSSYVFPNVNDFPNQFIEEGAAQANTYRSDGINYAYYHIELRAQRRSAGRNGDGTSDYAFSPSQLLDFYRDYVRSGEAVYFNESFAVYTISNGSAIYSQGSDWSAHNARITNVIDHSVAVPEPTTALLIALGLGVIFGIRLHKSPRSAPALVSSREA